MIENKLFENESDRRQSSRHSVQGICCRVVCHLKKGEKQPPPWSSRRSPGNADEAVVLDMSENGMGLILPFSAETGQTLVLDIEGFSVHLGQVCVNIVNVQKISGQLSRVGIVFEWRTLIEKVAYKQMFQVVRFNENSQDKKIGA
jgi:hypothetical protein